MAVRPADVARRVGETRAGPIQGIGMAILVIGILVVMVVPIKTWMLDILLVTNISISVLVILTTMFSCQSEQLNPKLTIFHLVKCALVVPQNIWRG